MTFIKQNHEGLPVWKLYDDAKKIEIFPTWKDVTNKILTFGILPTLLLYEKANVINSTMDAQDNMSQWDLN